MEEHIGYKESPWGYIPYHWGISTIKDETNVVTDYVANGSFASLAENVKYKSEEDYAVLIRLVDYNNQFKGDFVFIDKNAYEFLGKSKLYGDEIIISNVGANVGTVFKCPHLKYKMSLAPNSIMVKFKGNNDFYYYWLRGRLGQHMLQSIVTGSAQPKFNKTNFRDLLIPVPPLSEQENIASILKSFDDKIEVNRRINDNLEQQAQALFKSWFVDFEPFKDGEFVESELGMIPNGWRVVELQDLVTIKRGGSPRPIQAFLSLSGYHWLKISDATACQSPYIFEIKEFIKESGLSKTVKLGAGSLVLSNSATPGIPKILGIDSCIHDGWLYFPQSHLSKYFLYMLFKEKRDFILSQGNGSVFTNLKTDIVKAMKIAIPNDHIMAKFNTVIESLFNQIENKTKESRRLAELRDTLLLKLMSGELRVPDTNLINEMLEKGIR